MTTIIPGKTKIVAFNRLSPRGGKGTILVKTASGEEIELTTASIGKTRAEFTVSGEHLVDLPAEVTFKIDDKVLRVEEYTAEVAPSSGGPAPSSSPTFPFRFDDFMGNVFAAGYNFNAGVIDINGGPAGPDPTNMLPSESGQPQFVFTGTRSGLYSITAMADGVDHRIVLGTEQLLLRAGESKSVTVLIGTDNEFELIFEPLLEGEPAADAVFSAAAVGRPLLLGPAKTIVT